MKKYICFSIVSLLLFLSFGSIYAVEGESADIYRMLQRTHRDRAGLNVFLRDIVKSIIFGLVGILLAIIGYKLFDIITPFSLAKELSEDQNMAVGIVVGAIIIGISLVISKAIA